MIGTIVEQDKKAFKWLLYLDAVRGEHSTGVAYVDPKTEEINITKELGRPDYLWYNNNLFKNGVLLPLAKVVIGHNRYATIGDINAKNAHPFQHGSVVGAHNGTIRRVSLIPNHDKFDTDSEAIFHHLSEEDDATKVIGNLDGAYALTWWDGYDGKMKIIRNSERELYWTRRVDRDVIYWASERGILERALANARINHGSINLFEVDKLYSFNLNEGSVFRKNDWEIVDGVKGLEYKSYNYRAYGYYNSNNVFNTLDKKETKKNTYNISSDFMKEFRKWEGKEVEFFPGDVKKGLTGSEYREAYMVVGGNEEIRIYSDKTPHEKLLALGNRTFTCKIKKAVILFGKNGKKECYLLPDLRSIEPTKRNNIVPFDGGKRQEPSFLSFNGSYINETEWNRNTANGCSYCSSTVDIKDHDKLDWLRHDEFLCPECQKNNYAVEMAAQIFGYN